MKIPYRSIIVGVLAIAASAAVFDRAQAGGDHYFPPVTDQKVKAECGSCHLAFAPSMLPASSWKRMMADLQNHFGDDASIDEATNTHITRYLLANAADANGRRYSSKLMRGVSVDNAPLRITELPKWKREHREVPDWEWKHREVRTKANCTACHADAERGYYEDD